MTGWHETWCANCKIDFAVPGWFLDRVRTYKLTFYCPNGHPLTVPEGKKTSRILRLVTGSKPQVTETNKTVDAPAEADQVSGEPVTET